VLLAVAENARDALREGLTARGAVVERVAAYGSVAAGPEELQAIDAAVRAGRLDLLTFTSSSAARNLLAALGPQVLAVPVAAVGPVTARTARELGYPVAAQAEEHTMDGLILAVTRWWESR
jgi:uroporphyrinogen III methyltransferase/synthase